MLEPNKINRAPVNTGPKKCASCAVVKPATEFPDSKLWYAKDGRGAVCNACIKTYLVSCNWEWDEVDRVCQSLNIPFVPKEFERLHDINGDNVFPIYAQMFKNSRYDKFEWKDYNAKFRELASKGKIDLEMPRIKEEYYENLAIRWGKNYDEEELSYLESLYNGMLATQNINGALNHDQAQKLCKISLTIDERIRSGTDFDKMMSSYEKLTKIADFNPKNNKSDNDLSSMGEVVAWLEKRGWINHWYDGAKRDIVDEVIHSNQAFVQRLYTDETGIGDEITERIQQLKIAMELDGRDKKLETKRLEDDDDFFEIKEVDENYDNTAFEELMLDEAFESDTLGV